MMNNGRLLIVSNRLPITVEKVGPNLRYKRVPVGWLQR